MREVIEFTPKFRNKKDWKQLKVRATEESGAAEEDEGERDKKTCEER